MGLYFSHKSRIAGIIKEGKKEQSPRIEDEMLYIFSQKYLKKDPTIDFFIFGHRHILSDEKLNEKSRFITLGDWLTNFSYAVFDGKELELKCYTNFSTNSASLEA